MRERQREDESERSDASVDSDSTTVNTATAGDEPPDSERATEQSVRPPEGWFLA
jgi:hypothetical protein